MKWALDRLGPAYLGLFVRVELLAALFVTAVTTALLNTYRPLDVGEFTRLLIWSELLTVILIAIEGTLATRALVPAIEWLRYPASEVGSTEAWRAVVATPRALLRGRRLVVPFLVVVVPFPLYAGSLLDLDLASTLILAMGTTVGVAYGLTLHYFVLEMGLRPVARQIAPWLPADFVSERSSVSIRYKLIAAVPLINAITAVIVSALSSEKGLTLNDLGVDVVVALAVALSVSFALTFLLSASITEPVYAMRRATDDVLKGNLSVQVPVVTGDEIGELTMGFNRMVAGLAEREVLQEALGRYVSPEVSIKLMAEGSFLDGVEVDVSVMVIDVRGFTTFADQAEPVAVVGALNSLFELIVPIVHEYGGHANKFVGDGLLAVFGTPVPLEDHSRQAVLCALAIANAVEGRRVEAGDQSMLPIGIGVNSGSVVAGTIGGGGRLEFTVIGDTVNVAARVEAATRDTGDILLVCAATRDRVGDQIPGKWLERPSVLLKGKHEPTALYTVAPNVS